MEQKIDGFDPAQIRRWFHLFKNDNNLVELRLVNSSKTLSGYFVDPETIIRELTSNNFDYINNYNVYFVINPINEDCYERPQRDKIMKARETTNDKSITHREWVLLDVDCEREANICSTDEEHELAHQKAIEVHNYLLSQGFNKMIVCDSSSGYHIYLRCSLANTEENTQLIKRFLEALGMLFNTTKVKIDPVVFNAARIARLPGTMSRKGSKESTKRPQRMCKIVLADDTLEYEPNKRAFFENIANMLPEEEKPTYENNYSTDKFNLEEFLNKHNIVYKEKENITGGVKYILDHCPFDENHKGKDAVIFQRDNGAIAFHCFHASCSQNTWKDVRLKYEPDAYTKQDRFESYVKRNRYRREPTPFTPIVKDEQKGDIWLSMENIKKKKFDINEFIPSGNRELDDLIFGFKICDVSVWTGIRGCGKTSELVQLALNGARYGYRTGMFSGEMIKEDMKNWLFKQCAGKAHTHAMTTRMDSDSAYYDVDEDVYDKIEKWMSQFIWLYNNDYGNNYGQLEDQIRKLKTEKNIDAIILDNLMTLDIDDLEGDRNERQKNLMLRLHNLAMELRIHIHIVCHPHKQPHGGFLRMDNISGSGDIMNLAQNIFLLHRVNRDFEARAKEYYRTELIDEIIQSEATNIIEIAKCRERGSACDHICKLFFEKESNRLKSSISEQVMYGWEENAHIGYVRQDTSNHTSMQPNMQFDNEPEYISVPNTPKKTENEESFEGIFSNRETSDTPF